MKVTRSGLCVAICCLMVLSSGRFSSVAQPVSAISGAEESRLVGASGGPETSCRAPSTCMACIPTAGCTAFGGWTGMPAVTGWCGACTTAGTMGCATAAPFTVCSPTPGGTCTPGGGAAACGTLDTPVTPTATLVGLVWTCPATPCAAGAAGSAYCVNCI